MALSVALIGMFFGVSAFALSVYNLILLKVAEVKRPVIQAFTPRDSEPSVYSIGKAESGEVLDAPLDELMLDDADDDSMDMPEFSEVR